MKNKLFWGLVALAVAVIGIIAWAALASVTSPGPLDTVPLLCSLGVLAVAFVAWEFLMKPGYGWLRRRDEVDASEEEGAEGPPSARPP